MTRLAGKVALITGTGVGMGRAAALRFAAEGATVVGCDLNPQTSAETVRLVRDAGGTMTATAPVDLSSFEATQQLGGRCRGDVRRHRRALQQRLAAGGRPMGRPHRRRLARRYQERVRPGLLRMQGCLAASRRPRWRKHHQRRLDRLDPRRGVLPTGRARCRQGRGAVVHLPPCGRRWPAPHPRQRDPARPDPHAVDRVPVLLARCPRQHLAAANPLGRVGDADDVAKLAAFLASDDAWYINAAAIPVDGGQSVIE